MATTSSLQNINWLSSNEKCELSIQRKKMSIVPVNIPSLYNDFAYFLEGQVHKDSKLGVMTNLSKSRLVSHLYKHLQNKWCMCQQFWYCFCFISFKFLRKNCFLTKLKLISSSTPQCYNNFLTSTFLILFKNFLVPFPFKREGRDYVFYMRDYKEETMKLSPFYLRFFIYRTVKSQHLKKIKKSYVKWYT